MLKGDAGQDSRETWREKGSDLLIAKQTSPSLQLPVNIYPHKHLVEVGWGWNLRERTCASARLWWRSTGS